MFIRTLLFLILLISPIHAQESVIVEGLTPQVAAAVQGLPGDMRKALRERPGNFTDTFAKPIILFGRAGSENWAGVDLAGIETFIKLQRAQRRSWVLQRFHIADLNNDGAITQREIDVVLPTIDDHKQTSLVLGFHTGDVNGDGILAPIELRGLAQAGVTNADNLQREAGFRALMTFDLDRNGLLTLDEFLQVTAAFRQNM